MSSCSRTRTKAPRSARIRVSSSPAKIVVDLDDVLLHILSFLPIKTLIKCKRVSKRWRSLITNPNFSNRIISSKHPLPISGLYLKGTRDIEYRFVSLLDDDDEEVNEQLLSLSSSPLRFIDHPSPIIVMQSTNGLLLCKCTCPPNHFNRNFYVYNPTTKQKTLLPRIIDHVALSLAFDPSKSPHYKVFCLRKSSISSSVSSVSPVSSVSSVSPVSSVSSVFYHIEVYSSNEGPWRRLVSVSSFALPQTVTDLSNTVFWNGAVHWFWFGPNSRDCLSFDIDTEEIKTLSLPFLDHHQDDEEDPPDVGTLRFIEESRGNLYFIEVNDLSSPDLSVYEMNRTGLTWFLKYHVDLEPLAAAFPEMIRTEYYTYRKIYSFSVIGFVKGETDAESSYIVLHIPNKAVKYYFISKTFKKLCSFETSDDGGENFYGFGRSFQFIESLANV